MTRFRAATNPSDRASRAGSAADAAGIQASDVVKIFGRGKGETRALDGVSVTIHGNEFFTLLGPSGCGKTTLLRLIAGFDQPNSGQIRLDGEDIGHLPPNQRPVNTVFQSYALFPHMTVAGNIAFGLEMLGRSKGEIRARVDDMLALVRMEHLRDRRTDQISGGQQQRVALARALAPRPKVLLLDEPLSALDYKLRREMQGELKRLQHETGVTFVFVTHDQEEALTMSDRVAVMNEGRIFQIGSPREIYHRPQRRFVADFIGETNFLTADIRASGDGQARLQLDCGAEVEAELPDGMGSVSRVTAAIRPEHVQLTEPGGGDLDARIAELTFLGTDTLYRLDLAGGAEITARLQNGVGGRADAAEARTIGQAVGLSLAPGAVQVLRD